MTVYNQSNPTISKRVFNRLCWNRQQSLLNILLKHFSHCWKIQQSWNYFNKVEIISTLLNFFNFVEMLTIENPRALFMFHKTGLFTAPKHDSVHKINKYVDRERKLQHERWEQDTEARANVWCSLVWPFQVKLLGVRGVVCLEFGVRGVVSTSACIIVRYSNSKYAGGGLQSILNVFQQVCWNSTNFVEIQQTCWNPKVIVEIQQWLLKSKSHCWIFCWISTETVENSTNRWLITGSCLETYRR